MYDIWTVSSESEAKATIGKTFCLPSNIDRIQLRSCLVFITEYLESKENKGDAPWSKTETDYYFSGFVLTTHEFKLCGRTFKKPVLKQIKVNDRTLRYCYLSEIKFNKEKLMPYYEDDPQELCFTRSSDLD